MGGKIVARFGIDSVFLVYGIGLVCALLFCVLLLPSEATSAAELQDAAPRAAEEAV